MSKLLQFKAQFIPRIGAEIGSRGICFGSVFEKISIRLKYVIQAGFNEQGLGKKAANLTEKTVMAERESLSD